MSEKIRFRILEIWLSGRWRKNNFIPAGAKREQELTVSSLLFLPFFNCSNVFLFLLPSGFLALLF